MLGRWERVRPYHVASGQWRPPLMLDRRAQTFAPFACDEWVKLRNGRWVAPMAGGALSPPVTGSFLSLGSKPMGLTALAASTVALSSAYTFNSAGAAGLMRYVGLGKAVSNAYYYIAAAANGTQANVNDINAELRNDAGTGTRPNVAAPTLHSSGSANPNGESTWIGWHRVPLSAFTDVYGTTYWLLVGDADGNGTDFATLQYASGSSDILAHFRFLLQPWNTANGASTAPTAVAAISSMVLEYATAEVVGWSTTSEAVVTSNTERKGLRYNGFTESLQLWGITSNAVAGFSGVEVYHDDGTAPGGATVASGTSLISSTGGVTAGAILSAPYAIPKATAQRVVFTFGSATAQPRKLAIGAPNTYTTPLRAARPGGAGFYYAWANGTTNWANDDQDAQPDLNLIFQDQIAVGGGGGTSMLVHSGMSGGLV